MDNKYIGCKFLDYQGNVLEVMERYNEKWYLVKSPLHNWERKCGDLMTDEDVERYLSSQEKIKEAIESNRQYQERVDKVAKEAEQKRIEKENLYGYDAQMTDMQRGKVLKTLMKSVVEHGRLMTRKDFIKQHIEAGAYTEKAEGITSFYGSKWERKESKPKTEYRMYDAGEKSFYIITKTEYDFARYISKLEKIA